MSNSILLKFFIPELKKLPENKQREIIETARYNTFLRRNILGAVNIVLSFLVPFLLFILIPIIFSIQKGYVIPTYFYPFGLLFTVVSAILLHDLFRSLLIRSEVKRLIREST